MDAQEVHADPEVVAHVAKVQIASVERDADAAKALHVIAHLKSMLQKKKSITTVTKRNFQKPPRVRGLFCDA